MVQCVRKRMTVTWPVALVSGFFIFLGTQPLFTRIVSLKTQHNSLAIIANIDRMKSTVRILPKISIFSMQKLCSYNVARYTLRILGEIRDCSYRV